MPELINDDEKTKFCRKCETEKPLNLFDFENKEKNKYKSMCKNCRKLYNKNYYNKRKLHKENKHNI